MSIKTLEDLFLREVKDLLSAEKQLTKALPKMTQAATSDRLRENFEEHMAQTTERFSRLEAILQQFGKNGRGAKCEAMEGLIQEGSKMISEQGDPAVKDAGLIACAQRVEHYEIAGYGTARTHAHLLGYTEAEELLRQGLAEARATDERLTELAESEINAEAQRAK